MILNKTFRQLLLSVALVTSTIFSLHAQKRNTTSNKTTDSLAVLAASNQFLTAFINLNWEAFSQSFADDATAFFPPSAKFPYRANNKTEIENIFKTVFENAHKRRSNPPYLDIDPKDLKVQMLEGIAIVSFILNDPDLLGRRTFVWAKRNNQWKIVHLHASGAALPN